MTTALYEVDFFLLVTTSLLLPAGIYATLMIERAGRRRDYTASPAWGPSGAQLAGA